MDLMHVNVFLINFENNISPCTFLIERKKKKKKERKKERKKKEGNEKKKKYKKKEEKEEGFIILFEFFVSSSVIGYQWSCFVLFSSVLLNIFFIDEYIAGLPNSSYKEHAYSR